MKGRQAALLWVLLAAACEKKPELVVLKNECVFDAQCEMGAHCNPERGMCERSEVIESYGLILQVQIASQPRKEKLIQEVAYRPFMLTESIQDRMLAVPRALAVAGRVTAQAVPIEAQVTFTPVLPRLDAAGPRLTGVSSTVVYSRGCGEPVSDACRTEDNLRVELLAGASYEVRVQPLGEASSALPPMTVKEPAYQAGEPLQLDYKEMRRIAGTLIDAQGMPQSGHTLHLASPSGEVLSSIGKAEAGEFALYADGALLDSGAPYQVVIGLRDFTPGRATVTVTGQMMANGVIIMPSVPELVRYAGRVEPERGDDRPEPAPYADVTFVARPQQLEEPDPREWCRWPSHIDPSLVVGCALRVSARAERDGQFELSLLPGSYDVFASPPTSGEEEVSARLASLSVGQSTALVVPQPSGRPQIGATLRLPPAISLEGLVRSSEQDPMPGVSLRARALGFAQAAGEVGRYSRSSSALTNGRGRFQMPIDQGYFDLYVEPALDSGFAWVGFLNSLIKDEPGTQVELRPFTPPSPVYLTGQVLAEVSGDPLPGARVEAYAVVPSLRGRGELRTVRVAQTTADALGAFRLALPPRVGEPQESSQGDAGANAEDASSASP